MNRTGGWAVLVHDTAPDATRLPVPVKINGLPAHILLIHVVIVLLPLAAIMLVASAAWPVARRKLGFLTPAVALVALVFVPITTHAGDWLRARLPPSPAIERHASLGHELLPWAIGIFVVAAAVWVLGRRFEMRWRPATPLEHPSEERSETPGGGTATLTRPTTKLQALPVWVTSIVAAVAIAVSVGGVVQIYRIGDAGSQAVWSGRVPDQPVKGGS